MLTAVHYHSQITTPRYPNLQLKALQATHGIHMRKRGDVAGKISTNITQVLQTSYFDPVPSTKHYGRALVFGSASRRLARMTIVFDSVKHVKACTRKKCVRQLGGMCLRAQQLCFFKIIGEITSVLLPWSKAVMWC